MLLLTKSMLAIMIGFISATVLGQHRLLLFMIPLLRKLNAGQKISSYVQKGHSKKEGTPTMGGLIFIISTFLTTFFLIVINKLEFTTNLGIVLLVFIGYAMIGFLDDYLSIKKHNNE